MYCATFQWTTTRLLNEQGKSLLRFLNLSFFTPQISLVARIYLKVTKEHFISLLKVLYFCSYCSRNGVVGAKYLPLKIAFDPKTKRIHPEPKKNAKWIIVCGVEDKQCQPCHTS